MKVIRDAAAMKAVSEDYRKRGARIGFVPTMGYLHEGHMSLVRESRAKTDITLVSIFVNPAQFGPREDFQAYPRDPAGDLALLEKEGVDVVFCPDALEMYPPGYKTYVEVHDLQNGLCGRSRPGHFRGVCTVVLKLFNIVRPDVAFFGWKDAQQVALIKKMAEDLNLDVRVEGLPIVRDEDGVALSSRNSYLTPEERKAARALQESLEEARKRIDAGERTPAAISEGIRARLGKEPLCRVDYVEIVDLSGFEPVRRIENGVLIALAVFVGTTRLIDNIRITQGEEES